MEHYFLSHLDVLEAEAIHIMREVAAEFRRPVMMFGAVLGIVLSFPIFWMIAQGSTLLLFLGMIIGMPLVHPALGCAGSCRVP